MKRGRLIILLIEDEEHDVFFVRAATQASGVGHELYAVRDGAEAVRYLRGEGDYADRQKFPRPNLVLTDLKMPGVNGFDFLLWVREHPDWGIIPIVVYSSSSLESDVREAYRLGANAYITKPSSLAEMVKLLQATYDFWSRCECPMPRQG